MGGTEGQEAVDRNEERILKGQGEQENWHLWRISPRAQSWVFIHGKGVMAFPIGPLSSKHTDSPCFYCCYSMERDHYKKCPCCVLSPNSVQQSRCSYDIIFICGRPEPQGSGGACPGYTQHSLKLGLGLFYPGVCLPRPFICWGGMRFLPLQGALRRITCCYPETQLHSVS